MKTLNVVLMGFITMVFVVGMERDSVAFHNGGVGPCEGCHSMHNSLGGVSVNDYPIAHSYLLKEQDSSSTCLYCHQQAGDSGPTGYHVSTPIGELLQGLAPKQLNPGGDFGWLNKSYAWTAGPEMPLEYSRGERHGHNIVALDFTYDADSTNTAAPGGTYPASRLSCTSCHDPHGKYRRNADGSITTTGKPIGSSGSFASSPEPDAAISVGAYRLLGGKNYLPKPLAGAFSFVNDAPAAVVPDVSNRSEEITQTRVAYGAGMSEWCRNCHAEMHSVVYPGNANLIHPDGAAAKLGNKADSYNQYIKTGDLTGTAQLSYLSLVPFEEGTTDYPGLKLHAKTDDSQMTGPDRTTSQVMCLTCHRAHASGWDGITRWNTRTDYIVYNGLYAQEGQVYQPYGQGRTEAEARRAYYEKPAVKFALNQDSLCNKCHIGVYP